MPILAVTWNIQKASISKKKGPVPNKKLTNVIGRLVDLERAGVELFIINELSILGAAVLAHILHALPNWRATMSDTWRAERYAILWRTCDGTPNVGMTDGHDADLSIRPMGWVTPAVQGSAMVTRGGGANILGGRQLGHMPLTHTACGYAANYYVVHTSPAGLTLMGGTFRDLHYWATQFPHTIIGGDFNYTDAHAPLADRSTQRSAIDAIDGFVTTHGIEFGEAQGRLTRNTGSDHLPVLATIPCWCP